MVLETIEWLSFCKAYSPIEHLAKIFNLSRTWRETILGMFATAFDAGGTEHDQRFVVVAGFLSSVDDWMRFDVAWRERLATDGLTYFHMVDYAQFRNEFKHGWRDNEQRRRKLLADLMDIIRSHAYRKFGCIIESEIFDQAMSRRERQSYKLNAYALAGLTCAKYARQFLDGDRRQIQIRYVFEDGDWGKGKLIEHFKKWFFQTPAFELKRDKITITGTIPAFTPLQAADILAYEIFASCRENRPARWAAGEFDRMPGPIGKYSVDHIQKVTRALEMTLKNPAEFTEEDWNILMGKTY